MSQQPKTNTNLEHLIDLATVIFRNASKSAQRRNYLICLISDEVRIKDLNPNQRFKPFKISKSQNVQNVQIGHFKNLFQPIVSRFMLRRTYYITLPRQIWAIIELCCLLENFFESVS